MKKIYSSIFLTLIFILLSSFSLHALEFKYYLGGNLKYNAEEFNADSDHDNAYGFDLIAGTFVNDRYALEVQMEKILDFDTKNSVSHDSADIRSFTLNLKYYPGKTDSDLRGYVRAGFGWMKNQVSDHNQAKTDKNSEEDLCMKLGGGCDFKVTEIITFFIEATYTEGYSDLNPLDYYSGSIGLKLSPF